MCLHVCSQLYYVAIYVRKEYYDIGEVAIYVGLAIWVFWFDIKRQLQYMHRHLGT